jgi:hypothetical protein
MKYYTHDSVTVIEHTVNPVELITKLQKEGWKDLQYVAHDSWGDCRSPEIMGKRPMTIDEIKNADKAAEKHKREEIDKLHGTS